MIEKNPVRLRKLFALDCPTFNERQGYKKISKEKLYDYKRKSLMLECIFLENVTDWPGLEDAIERFNIARVKLGV